MRLENSHRKKIIQLSHSPLVPYLFSLKKSSFFFDYKFMLISFVIRDEKLYNVVWIETGREEDEEKDDMMCPETPSSVDAIVE